jgi:hypothetical protein
MEPPLPNTKIEAPSRDWIPLSRAPFKLDGWGRELSERYFAWVVRNSLPPQDGRIQFKTRNSLGVEVCFGSATLTLGHYLGDVRLTVEALPPDRCSISANIWDLQREVEQWDVDDYGGGFSKGDALRLLTRIVGYLTGNCEYHLASGSWRIMARVGSPLAPFKEIPYDVWRSFEVEDGERCLARSPDGARLFSIHVIPNYAKRYIVRLRNGTRLYDHYFYPPAAETEDCGRPTTSSLVGSGGAKRANAEEAIRAIYGRNPAATEISNETLYNSVKAWCEKNGRALQTPSRETVIRAAGRRAK